VAAVDRFVREARVTAQLEHPGIVPVYELGRRPDGTLYYVMKRVKGQTLSDAIRGARDLQARLALLPHFVHLCHAMAYAHSRGVVHRDLKPQNVMVGEFGETVVLDWGLAKVRGERDVRERDLERGVERILASAGQTLVGATMGTPAYMSPEQAHGRIDAVDERSDVWSLGAVLFEILTGAPPYEGETALEVLEKVRSEAPPEPRARVRQIPREIASVCARAMTVDAAGRYADARALARDVEAWQTGGQVDAYRYAWWEVLGRYLVRHQGAVTVLGLAVLALCTAGIVFLRHLTDERDRARAAEASAAAERNLARTTLAASLMDRATSAVGHGDAAAAWVLGAGALQIAEDPDARGALLAGRSAWLPRLEAELRVDGRCQGLGWSPDSAALACLTDGALHVWDDGLRERSLAEPSAPAGASGAVAWSADGTRLGAAGTGGVRLWDAATGRVTGSLPAPEEVRLGALDWHPDGRIFAGGADGVVRVWRDGVLEATFGAHADAIRGLDLSSDGTRVLTTGSEPLLRLWDGASLRPLAPFLGTGQGGRSVAFSPDGQIVAAAGEVAAGGEGVVRLWDVTTGQKLADLASDAGEVWATSWSGDGRRLAAGSGDGTIRVWDVAGRRVLGRLGMDRERVTAVAFSADGARLAAAGSAGTVRVYRVPTSPGSAGLALEDRSVNGVAWSPAGFGLAVGGEDGRVGVWDPLTGKLLSVPLAGGPAVREVAYAAAPGFLVVRTGAPQVQVVDAVSGEVRTQVPGEGEQWTGSALSPDRRRLALGLPVGFRVVDLESGVTRRGIFDEAASAAALAWTADGEELGVCDNRGRLLLVDPDSGAIRQELGSGAGWFSAVAFSSDGSRAAAASGSAITLFELPSGAVRATLEGHTDSVGALAFSPDGGLLASGGWDRRVAVWSAESGHLLARLEAHRSRVWDLDWAPDGLSLASASADQTARVWSLLDLRTDGARLLEMARTELGLDLVGAAVRPAGRVPEE